MRVTIFVVLALIIGAFTGYLLAPDAGTDNVEKDSDEPLYWVAPMDPNYRRDGPGKSPMGMDLVPVYEEGGAGKDSPGTVSVSPEVQQNLGVRTQAVSRGPLTAQINAVGYIDYNQDTLIHLHPRVSGWIHTLYVNVEGERIDAGEPLYKLYAPELVNAQKELLAALNRGDNTLITGARARLDALGMPSDVRNALEKDRTVRQEITFRAPKDGIVAALPVREGFYVEPNQNVMSIADLSEVWVDTNVFEQAIARIEQGLEVSMTVPALPGRTWTGEVDYIYPTLNSKTRTLQVRLRFDNPSGDLMPGMYASVDIHAPSEEVLKVPRAAVIRLPDSNRVVIDQGEGRFKSINVSLGRSDNDHFEVTEGLSAGDEVVVSAQFLIDSESSKESDFMRMSAPDTDDHSMHMAMDDEGQAMDNSDNSASSATVNGRLEAIDREARTLTIHRDAIEKWNRPAATMTFAVAPDIEIDALSPGQHLRFTFEVGDDFVITDLTVHDMEMDANSMEHDHD